MTDRIEAAGELAKQHLSTFDTLDFEVFSNQEWSRLHESHSHDVLVHWPDGHAAMGIEQHVDDMKKMFVHAPNTRIKQHPVRIAVGDWTSVIGVMEGTFSEPMTKPDGTIVQPTGKSFKVTMCTVCHWTEGLLDEEWLFWDNATYYAQIGVS